MTMTAEAAAHAALGAAMAADDQIVLLLEGGGPSAELELRFGSERVRRLPISDRATLGVAVGMALGGKRPVVELASTGRLLAGLEVLDDAAIIAARGEFVLPLVVRVPYGAEAGAGVDRAVVDALGALGGAQVVCARSASQAAGLLRAALQADHPVVILEPRAVARRRGPIDDATPALGAAQQVKAGDHVALVSWGAGVAAAEAAAESLASSGHGARVLDLVSLCPIDAVALTDAARSTGRLVVAAPADVAFGHRVVRVVVEHAFLYLEAPPVVVAATPDAILAAARDALSW